MSKTLFRKREHGSIVCCAFTAALPLFPVSFSCVHQHECDAIIWPVASKVRIEREGKQSELSPADEQDFSQTSQPVPRVKMENEFVFYCSSSRNFETLCLNNYTDTLGVADDRLSTQALSVNDRPAESG